MSNTASSFAEVEAAVAAEKAAFEAAFAEGAGEGEVGDVAAAFDADPLGVFASVLDVALFTAKALNEDSNYRSRELSLAITNLEQAQMWVQKAAS